jgi:hypothetical protein
MHAIPWVKPGYAKMQLQQNVNFARVTFFVNMSAKFVSLSSHAMRTVPAATASRTRC